MIKCKIIYSHAPYLAKSAGKPAQGDAVGSVGHRTAERPLFAAIGTDSQQVQGRCYYAPAHQSWNCLAKETR